VGETNNMLVREVQIINRQGLHARPVMRFVDLARATRRKFAWTRERGPSRSMDAAP